MKEIIDLGQSYKPHARQILAHTATERFVNYGGAFGGGKTVWLVNESIQLCLDYPGNVGYICRNELPAFRRSVLIELDRYIVPQILEQHHQTENYFRFKNGSRLFYGGLGDSVSGLQRLSSMSLGFFAIDQCEETTETHFNMLAGRLRLILPNIKYKGIMTCNPAPGWVKQKFIEQKLPDHAFIQAIPKDNPFLPADYEASLRAIYPQEWIKSMLEGDWSALEGGNFLIPYKDIQSARGREIELKETDIKWAGVDIAREGDDQSVFTVRQGNKVIHTESWMKTDLMQTTGIILQKMERFNIDAKHVNLDCVGVGAGVYDRLREQKIYINGIVAGGEPKDKEHYINTRAEMYDNLRKKLEANSISIPDDMDIAAQLSSIRFKIASDRKLQIISKEEMKKVYHIKSPDKADSLALAFYENSRPTPSIGWI
jgi:hypothetical protein